MQQPECDQLRMNVEHGNARLGCCMVLVSLNCFCCDTVARLKRYHSPASFGRQTLQRLPVVSPFI